MADGGLALSTLRVDGGAAASDLLMQMQADYLDVTVERPALLESTALGAAYMAGLGVGLWSGIEELESHRSVERVFTPKIDPDVRDARLVQWKRAVRRSLAWAVDEGGDS